MNPNLKRCATGIVTTALVFSLYGCVVLSFGGVDSKDIVLVAIPITLISISIATAFLEIDKRLERLESNSKIDKAILDETHRAK